LDIKRKNSKNPPLNEPNNGGRGPTHRTTNPELLHKKDRGRPTEAVLTLQRRGYGEQEVLESVPGAEVLRLNESQEQEEDQKKQDEVTVRVESILFVFFEEAGIRSVPVFI
jgi:hypothetical protein